VWLGTSKHTHYIISEVIIAVLQLKEPKLAMVWVLQLRYNIGGIMLQYNIAIELLQ